MRSRAEIEERANLLRQQIRYLKDMLNGNTVHQYQDSIYEVIYHFSDQLTLLKWVLKEDQNEKEEGTDNN